MPITELALVRLTPSTPITSPTLLANLSTALHAMADFTSPSLFPTSPAFHYYHDLSDPSLIYLLGSWSSLPQHLETWIPSSENQALLELLQGQVEVEWMSHVDVDPATLTVGQQQKGMMWIERFLVEKGRKEWFEGFFEGVIEGVNGRLERGGGLARGGWRIEEGEGEEYVLFTGWESVEKFEEFERTEGFKEYTRIRQIVEGSESNYAVRLEVD